MFEFLCIDIKKLDDGGFQFHQTGLIQKLFKDTGIYHCNGLTTPTKVYDHLGTYTNGTEANIYLKTSYDSIIGMMFIWYKKIIPDIYSFVHQYARFTYNTKESHETDKNMICWYIQGSKDRGLVFNLSKKMMVDCYVDADFVVLWGHDNNQ